MNNLTVLRFHAAWCNPCHSLAKTLTSVLSDFEDINVVNIDIDEDVESVINYKVRSVPTLVLIRDNQEIDRLIGNQNAENLRKFFLQ